MVAPRIIPVRQLEPLPMLTRRPLVAELQGGYRAPPIPPGWEAPPKLPITFSLEPPTGSWTSAGKYGRQFKGPIPDTAGSIVPIFENTAIDGLPRSRCVHLYRSDRNLAGHTGNNGFRLLCTYGQGGIQNVFRADWLQGGNFSLPAVSFTLAAESYAPEAGLAYSTDGGEVVLGAMLGVEGDTTPRDPITFTTERVTLAAGASVTAAVPDFARRVIPQITLNGATYADVEFALLNYGPRWNAGQFFAEIARDGVPLNSDTSRVFLENNNAAAQSMNVSFLFQLGI